MFVVCCVGSGLWDGLIIQMSATLCVCVCVCGESMNIYIYIYHYVARMGEERGV